MKKLLLGTFVLGLLAVTTTSCKKVYHCDMNSSQFQSGISDETYMGINQKKEIKASKQECEGAGGTWYKD